MFNTELVAKAKSLAKLTLQKITQWCVNSDSITNYKAHPVIGTVI